MAFLHVGLSLRHWATRLLLLLRTIFTSSQSVCDGYGGTATETQLGRGFLHIFSSVLCMTDAAS